MKKASLVGAGVVVLVVVLGIIYFVTHHAATNDTTTTPAVHSSQKKNDGSVKQQQAPQVKDGISSTQAGNIAIQQYGGTVDNVSQATYQDTPVWKVDIKDSAQGELYVLVDQSLGKIIDMKKVSQAN